MQEDVQEDYGWKLIHGEVFRAPRRFLVLSVAVGSGAQLVAMMGVTLFFALLGFLSPSNRGSLSTVMIVFWTLFSGIAGYVSSRLYISLGGPAWKQNVAATAIFFPT
jgi:transmembrane 9 superfamily member 2/4